MQKLNSFVGKKLSCSINTPETMLPIAHALSSETRLKILLEVGQMGLNVNEIARRLELPLSTIALNVKVLEEAGIVYTDTQPGARGQMKVVYRRLDKVHFDLVCAHTQTAHQEEIEIPVGCYSRIGDIKPTCGYADERHASQMDDISAFYDPQHFSAQILWIREGFIEYHLPIKRIQGTRLLYLEISFEACSEAPGHRNNWPSDIYVQINDQVLGTWHCPGDFGGRRGLQNPPWWASYNSQYGNLKTWLVNDKGSWLEKEYISGVTLDSLALYARDHIALRIGVGKVNGHAGGLNLFGRAFGDFPQGIVVHYGFAT